MSLEHKLDGLLSKHDELQNLLATHSGMGGQEYARLSKEFTELNEIVRVVKIYREVESEIRNLNLLLDEDISDSEVKALAEEELRELKQQLPSLKHDVQLQLLPKDSVDKKNAILEIRAGTGGEEAALFAANLFRMYQRFSEQHNWTFDFMDLSETGIGGYKEAIANITGKDVFAKLKFESGVHRVQRVPETESQGRVHTSAATVAVLPEAEEVDIEINKTDSAVRITHLPSKLVVQCQDEKSQHKNRAKAMKLLRSKLYNFEQLQVDQARAANRKNQVGTGDRSERIRTYNFPQGRVTDHRINLTLYKLDRVMEGDLDEIIDALTAEEQATLLASV